MPDWHLMFIHCHGKCKHTPRQDEPPWNKTRSRQQKDQLVSGSQLQKPKTKNPPATHKSDSECETVHIKQDLMWHQHQRWSREEEFQHRHGDRTSSRKTTDRRRTIVTDQSKQSPKETRGTNKDHEASSIKPARRTLRGEQTLVSMRPMKSGGATEGGEAAAPCLQRTGRSSTEGWTMPIKGEEGEAPSVTLQVSKSAKTHTLNQQTFTWRVTWPAWSSADLRFKITSSV